MQYPHLPSTYDNLLYSMKYIITFLFPGVCVHSICIQKNKGETPRQRSRWAVFVWAWWLLFSVACCPDGAYPSCEWQQNCDCMGRTKPANHLLSVQVRLLATSARGLREAAWTWLSSAQRGCTTAGSSHPHSDHQRAQEEKVVRGNSRQLSQVVGGQHVNKT